MEVEFIRLGMLAIAVIAICGGVYLAVKSPLFYALCEFSALFILMFASALFGLYAAVMLNRFYVFFIGIALSAPIVFVCRYRFYQVFRELKARPPLWS